MIIALLVVLAFIVPFVLWAMTEYYPKKDLARVEGKKQITEASYKITVTNKKNVTVYIYSKYSSGQITYTRERIFDQDSYKGTLNFRDTIEDTMQSKIDKLENELPEADIQVTFPD